MTTKAKQNESRRMMDPRTIMFNEKNPRSKLGDLSELIAGIKSRLARGKPALIQDVTARPFGAGHKIVAGSKRLAASIEAGATEIGVRIEDMTDEEAHETAVMENIHRSQMSTVDEIFAVGKMVENGLNHEEIATRFGRTPRWVATYAKIAKMPHVVLDKIDAGELSLADAQELCRMSNRDDIERIAKTGMSGIKRVVNDYLRDLSDAPWVCKGSPCERCLQRSDKQTNLFEDGGPARCMDSVCWTQKRDAWIAKRTAELRKAGHLPKQEFMNSYAFENHFASILNPEVEEEKAQIDEMEAAGIKPRFMIDEETFEVILRYDADDIPAKTVLTPSGDDAAEEENDDDLPEAMNALGEDDLADDEEQDENAPERQKPAWQLRAERIAELKESLADDDRRSIDSLKLLEYLAEVYRSNCSTPELEKLKEHDRADSVIGADTNCIKRAVLVDIVSHYFACDKLGDCVESVDEWEEFKRVFGIQEPEEVDA